MDCLPPRTGVIASGPDSVTSIFVHQPSLGAFIALGTIGQIFPFESPYTYTRAFRMHKRESASRARVPVTSALSIVRTRAYASTRMVSEIRHGSFNMMKPSPIAPTCIASSVTVLPTTTCVFTHGIVWPRATSLLYILDDAATRGVANARIDNTERSNAESPCFLAR